ncbi:acyltransferase family protein [Dysgonomonas macrotermitis]|uniref:Peptidoglycan/LPS O-acetylase OafA/YrhL, contains acyltransferase and SGNH-hydrolase domains n=1 Tax=Dysgonomonas macrotermitis TaxID=1346286 RepID=A0A1M5EIG8_9BACT|nr:acyltransferase [Dysgonomonas macrotermitis]SHF78966.1 Peptidoglycan/LPS O-acetylase OafA/YrhL, contains acyltransferase and SGNH-hydrolase domains [Dysgonomonas macrotermitis]
MTRSISLAESKPHYEILDGLRGVAAVLVVLFHVFEIHSGGDHTKQIINHGYLAVDFFFLLSGYVIGYAYDDRWGRMTLKDFFKRRVIRLQPMIIVGSLIGALLFYFQDSPDLGWGGISEVPIWKMLLVMVIGFTLIPVGKGLDIRGWNEMHPLNGPAWSLFFEYIANILYALVFRHLSKVVLAILVVVAAGFTIQYALTNPNGDIIGGWTIDDPTQLRIGFTRLAFPFLAGLLLARIGKLRYTKNAFLTASILLVILLAMPRLNSDILWVNGLYECFCLIIMFPLIVWLGAGGKVHGKKASLLCKFLGDISYPIYITHYPIIYIYMAWVTNNGYTLEESWPYGLLAAAVCIVVAYSTMKLYDLPVREWLRKRFLK